MTEPAIPIEVRRPVGNVLAVRITDDDLDWLEEQRDSVEGATISDVVRGLIAGARARYGS